MEFHHMKSGCADVFFIKENNTITKVRKQYFRKPEEKLLRETNALIQLNNSIHFPKVLSINKENNSFMMNYCGKLLKQNNLPSDWQQQITIIKEEIESKGIVNGDIDLKNLVVNNGNIVLLDFGNIRIQGEEFFNKNDYEIYKTKQHYKLFLICNALSKNKNAEQLLRKYNKEIAYYYSKK